MRTTIDLGEAGPFNWSVLEPEAHFLYRRMADQGRAVLGVGAVAFLERPRFDERGHATDWVFGALRYEWKDVLFQGRGTDPEHCCWFTPRLVVEWRNGRVLLHAAPMDAEHARTWAMKAFARGTEPPVAPRSPAWHMLTSRDRYVEQVGRLLGHLQRGDIYEINYCTTRNAVDRGFDPFLAFEHLLDRSQAPFAAFHRSGAIFALCASPERFLAFDGRRVIAQPMKGTRARHTDALQDRMAVEELLSDGKERSENIMALDVMRNDLSRVAERGTVKVEELCTVRSYPRVHQMISTVSARLRDGLDPFDVLRATFPMASMTGAPKRRAMELIELAEMAPRGLFSGSLGFFAPDGTGDLNVVIRTVLYDALTHGLSLTTGSAITALCNPGAEHAECEVKARSVIDALGHD